MDSWARHLTDFVSNSLWRLRPLLGSSISWPEDIFIHRLFFRYFWTHFVCIYGYNVYHSLSIYSASYRLQVYYNCYDLEQLFKTIILYPRHKSFFFLWTYSLNKLCTTLVIVRGSWRLVHFHCDSYIFHRDIYYISYEIFTANELFWGSLLRPLSEFVLYVYLGILGI